MNEEERPGGGDSPGRPGRSERGCRHRGQEGATARRRFSRKKARVCECSQAGDVSSLWTSSLSAQPDDSGPRPPAAGGPGTRGRLPDPPGLGASALVLRSPPGSVSSNNEQPRDLEGLGSGCTAPPLNSEGLSCESSRACPFASARTRLMRGSTLGSVAWRSLSQFGFTPIAVWTSPRSSCPRPHGE